MVNSYMGIIAEQAHFSQKISQISAGDWNLHSVVMKFVPVALKTVSKIVACALSFMKE